MVWGRRVVQVSKIILLVPEPAWSWVQYINKNNFVQTGGMYISLRFCFPFVSLNIRWLVYPYSRAPCEHDTALILLRRCWYAAVYFHETQLYTQIFDTPARVQNALFARGDKNKEEEEQQQTEQQQQREQQQLQREQQRQQQQQTATINRQQIPFGQLVAYERKRYRYVPTNQPTMCLLETQTQEHPKLKWLTRAFGCVEPLQHALFWTTSYTYIYSMWSACTCKKNMKFDASCNTVLWPFNTWFVPDRQECSYVKRKTDLAVKNKIQTQRGGDFLDSSQNCYNFFVAHRVVTCCSV